MPAPRDMTPEELLRAGHRMHRRLTRNLDHLDGGDAEAFDELSASVRTTLCYGRGDRLLLRLCNIFRVDQPEIVVPTPEVPSHASYIIGPMPDFSEGAGDGLEKITIPDWVSTQAVRLPGIGSRTWNQVLIDFGNTYGAHVSATVPQFLDDIRAYGVAGGTMAAHMMRSAGVIAEYGLGTVLAAIDDTDTPTPRDHHQSDVYIGMMSFTENEEARFSMSCTATETVELFSMPAFEGRRMTGTWIWDHETQTGSMRIDWSTVEN